MEALDVMTVNIIANQSQIINLETDETSNLYEKVGGI